MSQNESGGVRLASSFGEKYGCVVMEAVVVMVLWDARIALVIGALIEWAGVCRLRSFDDHHDGA